MTNQFERPMEVNSVTALVEDMATVLTGKPMPPGARVSFKANGATIHGKVVSIQKRANNGFAVNVRLNSLTRSDRDALENIVATG
jgi:hypothetical protein